LIILGGGAGTRLYPLTKLRAKPAVPLGAKYRLIDIPISNCINSEISRIYILTQFNSASLNRHIARTYAWAGAGFSPGFVEVLAAQQTPDSLHWFQGTADAVRQYLGLLAVLSQITENRKVEARKSLIFRHTIFTFGLKNATLRQNRAEASKRETAIKSMGRGKKLLLFS